MPTSSVGFGRPSISKSPWMNIMAKGTELIRLVVETFGQRDPDNLQGAVAAVRFEPERHRREAHEAVDQQPRADEEDERHRELRGDEQRPHALSLTVAGRALLA